MHCVDRMFTVLSHGIREDGHVVTVPNTGVLISPEPDQEGNKLGSTPGTHSVSTTSRRELSSNFFSLQGKTPEEIHAILTETLACFVPGQAKDFSAPL